MAVKRFTCVGVTGMSARYGFGTEAPSDALLLENCYPDVTITRRPQPVVPRPGFKPAPVDVSAVTSGTHNSQLVYEFRKLDGTRATVGVWNGIIHTYSFAGDAWTPMVTAANFATASITRSTSGRWLAVTFNGTVAFSDGTNLPFTWDGTSGAGGLVSLSNAAVAYGRPFVHAGKLGFIKNTDRGTFIWSEELAANTGYEAGGYNNAWTLKQNGSDPLVGMQGSNAGLFYFRTRGIGLITGDVTPDFATSGTDDAIVEYVGLGAPDAFLLHEKAIWFLDAKGLPWVLGLDGSLDPLWADNEAGASDNAGQFDPVGIGTAFPVTAAGAVVAYNPALDHVVMHPDPSGASLYSFSPYTRRLVMTILTASFAIHSLAAVQFSDGSSALFAGLNGSRAAYLRDGYWSDIDVTNTTTQTYTAIYRSTPAGWSPFAKWDFDGVDLVVKSHTDGRAYSVRFLTSENPTVSQAAQTLTAVTPSGISQIWYGLHQRVGSNRNGRWAVVDVRWTVAGTSGLPNHVLYAWSVRATAPTEEQSVR